MKLLDQAPLMRPEKIKESVLPAQLPISAQVAGTNGKGSTCAFLAGILSAHGYRVGLYTSPHIDSYTERIEISGEEISKEDLQWYVLSVNAKQEGMCQSDLLYFAACDYFVDNKVDFIVFETGLGGRRDSATLTYHEYGILTHIALDHTRVLGETVEQMTWEKCGIIKPGMTIVSYPNQYMDIIREESKKAKKLIETGKLHVSWQDGVFTLPDYGLYNVSLAMAADFQVVNAACAVCCAKEMLGGAYDPEKTKEAIENTVVFGRMSMISNSPYIVADVAHNPDGIDALCREIDKRSGKKIAVFGVNEGKDDAAMLARLRESFDQIVFTQASERGKAPYPSDKVTMMEDSNAAIDYALSQPFEVLVFCGSFDMVKRAAAYYEKI